MTSKEQLQQALDSPWERYGNMLALLDDAVTEVRRKTQKVIREVVNPTNSKARKIYRQKIKELETEIEKLKNQVQVEARKEVEKLKRLLKRKKLRLKNCRGLERTAEKEIEVPVEVVKEVVKEKVVEGPRRTQTVELTATGDLRAAATLIANSELINDLSTEEIPTMLKNLSAEEVNNKLGFWAIRPFYDKDDEATQTLRYTIKK